MEKVIDLFRSPATSLSSPSSMGKDLATDHPPTTITSTTMDEKARLSNLEALPAEIIIHILTFLPPLSLVRLSRTSRLLRSHAYNDLLWSVFIRQNVPGGESLILPASTKNWRDLYIAHHPYWFLPRFKVWFADLPNTGKIILARYNEERGCIEAYQLIAEHSAHTFEAWAHNPEVLIHTFHPKLRLWTDDPVVLLDLKQSNPGKRLQKEVAMHTGSSHGICSMISLCQPIPKELQERSMALWPPFIVPAQQRVRNESANKFRSEIHRPNSLDLLSDQTFRVRKWLEFSNLMQAGSVRMGEDVMTFSTLPEEVYTPTKDKPFQGLWVGDYSGHGCEFLLVLQRPILSNTKISRESSTGSLPEGVSIQHLGDEIDEDTDEVKRKMRQEMKAQVEKMKLSSDAGPSTGVQEGSSELGSTHVGVQSSTELSSSTAHDDERSKNLSIPDEPTGRLEAIKLTGDINVPRGQYTWLAEDIGPKGLIRVGKEQMFDGARIVKSWGRIAGRGFKHDRFIPSQLILISHDSIAQYWEDFGHISFYQRINIDDYLYAKDMDDGPYTP